VINFRYHLVSVAAILIALAAGIALGSGPLEETSDSIRGTSNQTVDPAVGSFEQGFADRTAGDLLTDKLKGQTVVVLTTPGAVPAEVAGVTTDLEAAGAEVTGEVELTSKVLDSASRQFAEGVAQQSAGDVPTVAEATDSYGRIGAALARAFMADEAAAVDPAATTIRSAFTEGDLVTLKRKPEKLATLAVVVSGPSRGDQADQGTVVAALAGAMNGTGKGVVVTGPASSSTEGGAVKALRDSEFATSVSSVDVTDSATGRIVAALAAAAQVGGQPGAWGTSRSAGGALPE